MSAKKQTENSSAVPVDNSITQDNVDPGRRRLLIGGASVVGGAGAAALAVSMLSSMSPSARAKAAGAPVEADLSKLASGQMMTVEWRGKPVWIVRRSDTALEQLKNSQAPLADPDSLEEQQPAYAQNAVRSINEEFLVVIGICTHLGCSPTYRPELAAPDLGSDWEGGFFCPCHGSKFDMAGRVYAGVPAPTNLEIPPYMYVDDNRILIGEDQGAAA